MELGLGPVVDPRGVRHGRSEVEGRDDLVRVRLRVRVRVRVS